MERQGEGAEVVATRVSAQRGVTGEAKMRSGVVDPRGHMPVLDGVRGLAILLVLITHFVADVPATNRAEWAITRVAGYGMFGVDLFFVLSGFLITGILIDSKKPGGYSVYFRNFYMRRSLRIFPLYYGVLVCIFAIAPLIPFFRGPQLDTLTHEQGWAWTYLVNVFIWHHGGYGLPYIDHFWSLAVEEHFYFFWPLVVWACPRPALVKVSLWVAIASLVARMVLSDYMLPLSVYVLTPFRLSALCLGGLLAAVARAPGGVQVLNRAARPMSIAAVVTLVGTYAFNQVVHAFFLPLHELRNTTFTVLFGALIVHALVASPTSLSGRFLYSSSMRFLGKYSYGLYVFHHFFSYYFVTHDTVAELGARIGSHTLAMALLAVVGSGVSLLVAMASYRFYEKPFLALKRYWPSGGDAPLGEAAAPAPAPLPVVPDSPTSVQ